GLAAHQRRARLAAPVEGGTAVEVQAAAVLLRRGRVARVAVLGEDRADALLEELDAFRREGGRTVGGPAGREHGREGEESEEGEPSIHAGYPKRPPAPAASFPKALLYLLNPPGEGLPTGIYGIIGWGSARRD